MEIEPTKVQYEFTILDEQRNEEIIEDVTNQELSEEMEPTDVDLELEEAKVKGNKAK